MHTSRSQLDGALHLMNATVKRMRRSCKLKLSGHNNPTKRSNSNLANRREAELSVEQQQ
jgi:hypothetical protein